MQRVITKKNLISFGLITLFVHVLVSLLSNFINIYLISIVDSILIGVLSFATIIHIAKQQTPIRFQPAQILLILFMAWFVFSCISMSITYDNDWVNYNSICMLNTAVSMFLAFPLGYVMIREENNQFGKVLLHILLLSWTLFIAFVLIRVFQGGEIITPNDGIIRMKIGLELNCHYNVTGAYELLFFLVCCFMTIWCKQFIFKIVYGLSTIIHFFALSLSNSRTSVLSALVGFMALTGITVYLWLKKNRKPHQLIISVFAALTAGTIFYCFSGLVLKLYNICTDSSALVRSTISEVAGNMSFTGRTKIWEYTIKGIFSSFRTAVFGVTPMSAADMINQMMGTDVYAHAHNQLLQIAASIGIPGLCIFLAWFYIMLRDSYRLYFVRKNQTLFLFVPVLIMVLMLSNMMEVFLVFFDLISGYVFFLLCGMLYGKVNEPVQIRQLSRQEIRNKQRKKKK